MATARLRVALVAIPVTLALVRYCQLRVGKSTRRVRNSTLTISV